MPLLIKTTGFEEFLDPTGGAYIKTLIMGDHGVGKTPSACCWPKPILADCERGRMSVASMGVPYVAINSSADMDALLDHLRRECLKPANARSYQTLIVDTVDTYQRKLIQERLKSERKESLSGWADWGWLDGKMILLIERLLNLPMNVVVNMHTKDVTDEDGEESRLVQKARLKGDIKDSIFQDFDLIGRMEQSYVAGDGDKKGQRVRVRQIRWHSEPKYPSLRDRSNKLPRFTDVDFTENDYWRIFNAITEGLDDLPESKDLETLEVKGDAEGEVPGPNEPGGPVDQPALPRKATKTAAKKAPAKKAAAKAEPKATPVEQVEQAKAEAQAVEDPWAPASDQNGKGTAEVPVVLPADVPMAQEKKVVETLDHVHSADGACLKNTFGDPCNDGQAAIELVQEKLGGEIVEEPAPEPEKPVKKAAAKPAAQTAVKAAKHCGDQPDSMVKFEAAPGCGKELNAGNAGRAQIAVLKAKTYLCDDCFAEFTTNK